LKAGDYVLVLGVKGISIFRLQFAVAAGAVVIATSSADEKPKIASKLGAKHVINYKTTPNWDDEVLQCLNFSKKSLWHGYLTSIARPMVQVLIMS